MTIGKWLEGRSEARAESPVKCILVLRFEFVPIWEQPCLAYAAPLRDTFVVTNTNPVFER